MAHRDYSRLSDQADTLGQRLLSRFEDAERGRQDVEKRWIKALRMYRGQYDEETEEGLDPNRSRTFIRVGRVKVENLTRLELANMLGNNDTSWTIEATPNPDVSDQDWEGLVQRVLEAKPDAGPADFEAAVRALADIRARNMSREIRDQLDGNEERRWSDINRQGVFSKNLYGTGCLKGPLVEEYERTSWKQLPQKDEQGEPVRDPQTGQPSLSWQPVREKKLRPYVEHVPVWDLYPDPSAKSLPEATFIFQRHIYTKPELRRLGKREDFDSEKINAFLRELPEGNADTWKSHEAELNTLSDDRGSTLKRERQYELLEFWGLVRLGDLVDCGCEVEEEADLEEDVWGHCWILGPMVIKVAIQPLDNITLPYYFGYCDKDESSIWGFGVMDLTEDTQDMLNSAVRILLDNAAICAGPQIEINRDLIDNGEDEQDIQPFGLWFRGGNGLMADANAPALRVYTIPSMSQDVLSIIQLAERFNDEVSGVPSSDTGDIGRIGKDQTATEASIRTQRSNAMVREQNLRWDDHVTRPLITNVYRWNMKYNDRPDIKGDFEIKARGTAGTQAKEIRAQQLVSFWQMVMSDPEARATVKVDETVRVIGQNMEIPDSIMKDKEEYASWQQKQMEQQAMMQGQLVLKQIGPVLQEHQQAIQQLMQGLQELMGQAQAHGDQERQTELALKAREADRSHEIRQAELALRADEGQTEKLKVAGHLAAKKADIMTRSASQSGGPYAGA